MKTAILVAARLHSTRLKRKVLIRIGEKTILEHLVDRVRQAEIPDIVVICTSTHPDDYEIIQLAQNCNIRHFTGSEDDVLDRFIKAADRERVDTVVRVTGDNLLTDPEIMDEMLRFHQKNGLEYTYVEDTPRGTRSEILSIEAMKRAHALAEDPLQTEYMSLYFKQPEYFNLRKYEVDGSRKRSHYRLTLDTPDDLKAIKTLYDALYDYDRDSFPSLREIIEYLDEHPEVVKLNSHITPKWEDMDINSRMKSIETKF